MHISICISKDRMLACSSPPTVCVCKGKGVPGISDRDSLNGLRGIKSYSTSIVVLGTEQLNLKGDSSRILRGTYLLQVISRS